MESSSEVKLKLLIVEDDIENQKLLRLFLKKYFSVDICDSAETFYRLIEKNEYEIIIMDISIKGDTNGLDLTREFRVNPIHSKVSIICYTAHAFSQDRINALDAGCDVYISKPNDIYTLLNAISELLKAKGIHIVGNFSST
jgi:DNA-binding response OmpR family regulator